MEKNTQSKPPLGLTPKKFHEENSKIVRFNEVCGAITRYYHKGLKINPEWIEEYNELLDFIHKRYNEESPVKAKSSQCWCGATQRATCGDNRAYLICEKGHETY